VRKGRETQLLKIIAALQAARRLARGLHRRQEQSHENADNRDHDQQFD
jgi:hypothetical protein